MIRFPLPPRDLAIAKALRVFPSVMRTETLSPSLFTMKCGLYSYLTLSISIMLKMLIMTIHIVVSKTIFTRSS